MSPLSKTLLAAIVLSAAVLPLLPAPSAMACSCIPPGTPQAHLEHAAAVFSGKVTNVDENGPNYSRRVTFNVDKSWKGVTTSTVEISTARDSAACGYNFEKGKDYVVYAYDNDGQLATGLCERTALASDASADIAALGTGTPAPTPEASARAKSMVPLAAAAVGVAVLGGLLASIMRRKKA